MGYVVNCRLGMILAERKCDIEELSEETGIGISTLYKYMRDSMQPNLLNAIKIADYLQCSIEDIWSYYYRR